MTSPTPVGSVTVLIRATVDNVKRDIVNSVKAGWAEAEKNSLASGRNAGKRWATGFNAGITQGRIAQTLDKQFKDAERQAGLSGGRAGARYAAAFNQAAKSANPPDPSPAKPRTATPRAETNNGTSGGGGGSSGAANNSSTNDRVKDTVSRHTIRTVLDDQATGILRQSLAGLRASMSAVTAAAPLMLAGLAVGPALASIAALSSAVSQLGGAMLLIPAAANALALPIATIKLGTNGVKDAFTAMGAANQNTAATAKAVTAAQKGVVSAQRGVQNAQDNVASSERGVAAAVRNTARARDGLNDAIDDTVTKIRDLNLEMKGAALDEEDAQIGLLRAQERLRNMPSGSTALDYREAALGVKQAQQRIEEVRNSNTDLAKETAKANADGVDGARAVKDARQGVADAVQGEADANKNLEKSQQALVDSNTALADAIQGVQDAANNGGLDKLQEAMDKLSPSAQDFVTKMYALGPAFSDMRKAVQENLFKGLGDDASNLATLYLPVLQTGLGGLATTLNGVAKDVIKAFAAPDAIEKFQVVMANVNQLFTNLSPGIFALVGVFKNLATVGSEFLPQFGTWFSKGAQQLEKWSLNFDRIRSLIQGAFDAAKILGGGIADIYTIVKDILSAGVGPGMEILKVFGALIDNIRTVVDSTSGKAGLAGFFSDASTMVRDLLPAMTDIAFIIGDILGKIAGLGVDIAPGLVDFFDGLRTAVDNLTPAFDVLGPMLSNVFSAIGSVLPNVGSAISVLVDAMQPLVSTFTWLIENGLPPLLWLFEKIAPVLGTIAPYLIGAAVGWKAISLAMGGFKAAEGAVTGIMDKVRGALGKQKTEQDGKADSSRTLTRTQEVLQTTETETEDTVDRVTTAIRQNTDATAENARAPRPDPFGLNDGLRTIADDEADAAQAARLRNAQVLPDSFVPEPGPTAAQRRAADAAFGNGSSEPPRNSRGFRTDPVVPGPPVSSLAATALRSQTATFEDDEDEDPKKPRSRTAAALSGVRQSAGAGIGLATVGAGLVGLGGEEGVSGAASMIGDTFAALKDGDLTTVLSNFGTAQESLATIGEGFGQLKDSLSGVGDMAKGAFSTLKEGPKNIKAGFDTAKTAVSTAGTNIKSAGTAIKEWNIGAKLSSAITKVWAGVQAAFNLVMAANPIVLVVLAIAALVAAIVIAYKNSETFRDIVQAVWAAIQVAIQFAWENIIKPVFDALVVALHAVGDFFGWVWSSLIKPAWDALGAGISWVWENMVKPAFDLLHAGLQVVGDFFKWVWETLIKPAWDALGAGISFVWEKVISPAFDLLKAGLQGVGDFFGQIVGVIETVWNKVIDIVKVPAKFVIDTVYNKGIVGAWNGIAGFIGLDDKKLSPIELPPGFKKGGITEGVMSGYTPGRDDRIIQVGGGEAIMRPEVTRAVGSGWVNGANQAARNGGVQGVKQFLGDPAAYADGGIVESMGAAVKSKYPGMQLTSGLRFTDNGYHSKGMAADFSDGGDAGTPGMSSLAQWIRDNFMGPTIQLIHHPFGHNVGDGADVGDGMGYYGPETMMEHRNHVHWAVSQPVNSDGAGEAPEGGWLSRAWDSVTGLVRGGATAAFDLALKPIDALVNAGAEKFANAGAFGKVPKGVYDKIKGAAREFISGKDSVDTSGGGGSTAPGGALNGTADQYRPLVERLFEEKGIDKGYVDKYLYQLQRESSFNPNAINLTDSNAVKGTPSKGIAQVIDPTFQSNKDPGHDDIWNAEDNIRASLNYLLHDPKFGGRGVGALTGAGYDSGGYLQPGKTLVNNSSGVPEPVFSGAQWDILKQGLNTDAGNKYLADNLPSLGDSLKGLAVDAFKETVVSGLFGEDTLGIDGIINKAVDQAVANATAASASAGTAENAAPVQATTGIQADTVIFQGMDPQKVGDEVTRAVGAGMNGVSGRYREP